MQSPFALFSQKSGHSAAVRANFRSKRRDDRTILCLIVLRPPLERSLSIEAGNPNGMSSLVDRFRKPYLQTDISGYLPAVARIREQERSLRHHGDAHLGRLASNLRNSVHTSGNTSFLTEAYALVSETAARVLGMRPFDVQLIGALA